MTDIQNPTEDTAQATAQVDNSEAIQRLFTPELAERFNAIGIAGVEAAIDIALTSGKTEEQVAAELKSDIEQLEGQRAEQKAHAEAMEAAAKAEGRRIERLTTASIILGHLIASAEPATDRRFIVKNAVQYADDLLAAIDAVEAPETSAA